MQFHLFPRLRPAVPGRLLWMCIVAGLFCVLATSVFWPAGSSAHVPITTKIMFNREVVRILQRNCIGCHRSSGLAFSLATYDEARPWAKDIEYELLRRKMPPWNAVKGFGDFINSPQLTQRDIDLIVNWTEGGTPKGEDKDLPQAPLYRAGWQLGHPDVVLKTGAECQVGAGQDKYETFSIETGLNEDQWLRAIDLNPGNASIVHCADFYLEGGKGSSDGQFLSSWIPGQKPVVLPNGVGWLLSHGSRIKVKIHYHGGETAATDWSEVGIYLTGKRPDSKLSCALVGVPSSVVPTGEATRSTRAEYAIDQDCELVAIRPASGQSVLSLQVTAYRPDGTQEVLIWTKGATYDWAPVYYLRRPSRLPKGTRIETVAYVDEPDPKPNGQPKETRWSDISGDPICILLVATKSGEAEVR